MTERSEFSDRVVLVTGSSSGIGEEVARRFAALGASVVVNSSSSVEAGERVMDHPVNDSWSLQFSAAREDTDSNGNTVLVQLHDDIEIWIDAPTSQPQQLIAKIDISDVSSSFAMEQMKYTTKLPLEHLLT